MAKKIKSILIVIVGVVSIVMSIHCYGMYTGVYASKETYGGDAYTGIQNAAAITARNLTEVADIERYGFGSVLLVAGLYFIAEGVTGFIPEAAAPAAQPSKEEEAPKAE